MSLGLRHVQKRRKSPEKGFPTRRSMLRTATDILIYPVAIIAPFALLPQVTQLYVSQRTGGLSLLSWALFVFINCLWIFYAYVHREKPILITNIAAGLLNAAVVVGILLYR